MHTIQGQSIPCWSGSTVCKPGLTDQFVWELGMVSVNNWTAPSYRSAAADGVPEMEIARIVREDLGSNPNATKHLLPSLGWQKAKAKWNGCAYSRAIWVQDGYWVENGFIHGPARNKQRLGEHFEKAAPAPLLDEEFSKVEVQPVAEGDLY